MAVQDYKINYKSDFVLTINGDAGWAIPFCIKFWTGMPSQAYFVGFDGVKYVNCRVGDTPTQLLVMFDDHHLPIGKLKMQIAYHTTIEEFPGSVFDEVTNARDVIVNIDGTDYQVLLDFTGEDAPELEFDLPAYANEAERIQNELQRQQNEADRIAAELQREQASAAAVQGAENVNAQLSGNILTVTNRQGVSTSVDTKGERGERGPVGPEGPQGQTGISITGFVETGETETDTLYNITFSNGTTQAVAIPKGERGDRGPAGPTGPQGPMGDVAVITPEQQAAFTMYSVPGQNTDGPMTQKAVTDTLAETSVGLVGGYIDVSDAIVLTDGTYILYDTGKPVSLSSFSATDYIKIKNEIGLKLKLKMPIVVAASSRAGVAFYDENKTYIFGVKVNYDEERGVETREIDVPFNARYFRTTYWSGEAKETYPATNVAFTCIISEAQGDSVEGLIPCNVRFAYSGYGINAKTGENAANSYMDATDYVEILPYSQYLKVMVPLALSNAFNGIVFYNASKQYVGGNVMPVATERGAISRVYKIPANAKFFRTYYWNASSIETYELPSFSCNFCYDIPEREEDITPMFRFTTEHAGINPSTGGLVYNDAIKFVFSNYVDISGFEKLVVSQSMDTTDRNSGCAFYDEDYNYISGQAWITTTDIVKVNNVVLDIPVGAKYVRTTFFDNYQIETNNLFPFTAFAIGNGQTAENGRTIGEFSEFLEKMKPYYTGENPYPKFIPIGDSGFYTAPEVTSAPSSSDTTAEMIAKYDALIVANPGILTKKDLGVASDGVSHLYAYEIEPVLPGLSYRSGEGQYYSLSWDTPSQPTIVVTSGVHGNEKVAVLALYNLIEQMLGDPNDNTDYILNNSRLCIIPVVNPYGYDHQQRFNANNKDINNDYGTWSQAESVIVRDYVASLSNVVGFLDCHTTASKPSIWAAADNETCKNLAFNLYQRLYKKWTVEIPSLLSHLPLMMFYLNCWKGPASNYFYDKGLISLTAETVASVQKNIIDGQGGQDNYDIPAVEFGMDIYGNTLIFMIKAIFAARCEDYGVQTFKVVVHPQSVTLSSASDVTFKAWATGKEIQYAWKKSTNGGSSWTDMNNHSPVLTLPSNQVADGVLVRCRCQDSDGLWLYTNTASITIE